MLVSAVRGLVLNLCVFTLHTNTPPHLASTIFQGQTHTTTPPTKTHHLNKLQLPELLSYRNSDGYLIGAVDGLLVEQLGNQALVDTGFRPD